MVGVSASADLALHNKVQKFSSGTGTSGWSRKKSRKTVVVRWSGRDVTKFAFAFNDVRASNVFNTVEIRRMF